MKYKYMVIGYEYATDGVYWPYILCKGSYDDCCEFINSEFFVGQYIDMTIKPYDKDACYEDAT